jgi:hypothetical protein
MREFTNSDLSTQILEAKIEVGTGVRKEVQLATMHVMARATA